MAPHNRGRPRPCGQGRRFRRRRLFPSADRAHRAALVANAMSKSLSPPARLPRVAQERAISQSPRRLPASAAIKAWAVSHRQRPDERLPRCSPRRRLVARSDQLSSGCAIGRRQSRRGARLVVVEAEMDAQPRLLHQRGETEIAAPMRGFASMTIRLSTFPAARSSASASRVRRLALPRVDLEGVEQRADAVVGPQRQGLGRGRAAMGRRGSGPRRMRPSRCVGTARRTAPVPA